jgi:regulatory protein
LSHAPSVAEKTPLERAKAVALRYLAATGRTEAQVRARLARAELSSEAEVVVSWLLGLGYLDDAAYARGRARSLVQAGRAGPRLAERRLVEEGVAPVRARAAVAGAIEEATERSGAAGEAALCRALAARRARTDDLAALDDRARARLARWLAARGFAGRVVASVLGTYDDV